MPLSQALEMNRTNAMREIPCRAIRSNSQVRLQLIRRDAFLGVHDDCKGHEPLVQGEMRVIEDRAACA